MKKIFILALTVISILALAGCSSKNNDEVKTYKPGEKAIIKNEKGKEMYSLTIDSVKKVDDFEYKDGFSDPKEVIEVTYSYENLNSEDMNIIIHGADLTVLDSNNTVAQSSSMFTDGKPTALPKGANCTVNAYYGLENKSDKVKVVFESGQYDQKVEFEAPIIKDEVSQNDLNKEIEKKAVKGDFVKINGDEMNGKEVFVKGEVSNIISDGVMPTFDIKTKEGNGYGLYEIKLISKDMLKDIEEGKTVTVYGKVLGKNDSGMPQISGNSIK